MPIREGLSERTVHLCVDMQDLFAADTPWHTPWMNRVLPKIVAIAEAHPRETIYSRFIPPPSAEQAKGSWRTFYQSWPEITGNRLDPSLLELVPPLRELSPLGTVIDKPFFSPFHQTDLAALFRARRTESVVITGAETDMCVLAAVLDAVDFGLRVVLPVDALCSSSDEMHDALIALYEKRFSQQIETTLTADLLEHWPARI